MDDRLTGGIAAEVCISSWLCRSPRLCFLREGREIPDVQHPDDETKAEW